MALSLVKTNYLGFFSAADDREFRKIFYICTFKISEII